MPTHWDGVYTQAEVLERISPRIVADFDCPLGPHDWLWIVAETSFGAYGFCANCSNRRRRPGCQDTERNPLEVINALRSSR